MVHWSGQLSMKDDFLALWSAWRVMRVREGHFERAFGDRRRRRGVR